MGWGGGDITAQKVALGDIKKYVHLQFADFCEISHSEKPSLDNFTPFHYICRKKTEFLLKYGAY